VGVYSDNMQHVADVRECDISSKLDSIRRRWSCVSWKLHVFCCDNRISLEGIKALDPSVISSPHLSTSRRVGLPGLWFCSRLGVLCPFVGL
jgi:hypothetical protein